MYFTNNNQRTDGFGAQFQEIIYAILCAELRRGGTFLYSRPNLEVVYGDEASMLESYMNMRTGFAVKEDGVVPEVPEVLRFHETREFVERNLDECLASATMSKVRAAFMSGKASPFPAGFTHVAVHIRRPSKNPNIDVPEHHGGAAVKGMRVDQLPSDRFTSNGFYLSVIHRIRSTVPCGASSGPLRFHIFSEGDAEDFSDFVAPDTELHLNTHTTDAFTALVCADVLVTCRSSFSYMAALLSEKQHIYYQPFWHPPATHWHIA